MTNHSPSTIKHVPSSIEYKISRNFVNEDVFNKQCIFYNNVLKIAYINTQVLNM